MMNVHVVQYNGKAIFMRKKISLDLRLPFPINFSTFPHAWKTGTQAIAFISYATSYFTNSI